MARDYSDDATNAARGGDLGFFPRQKMVKPFEDAAFAMSESGQVSAPVETQFGYHIIRFNERSPERQLSFDEAKAGIIRSLKTSLRHKLTKDKIAEVQSGEVDFGLEVDLPLLNDYVEKYSAVDETGSK